MTTSRSLGYASHLISLPTITPLEGGALDWIRERLNKWGFTSHWIEMGDTVNLFSSLGSGSPHFCFLGHTDVVPPGDEAAWRFPPFSPTVEDGMLWGRGSADMKGGIACFLSTIETYLVNASGFQGTLSVLLTTDEEGEGTHGIKRMVPWLEAQGIRLDFCLVGEPTSEKFVGDTLKIGRRGSLTGTLTCWGTQGHIAYPHLADNPTLRLIKTLQVLLETPLDQGMEAFDPSHLEVTSIDVGNPVSNVIPGEIRARFGVRFNPHHTGASLETWIRETAATYAGKHTLDFRHSGDPFLTTDQKVIDQVKCAVSEVTGAGVKCSTSGGTSDGRFMHRLCPVIECGLLSATIHQVDERVALEDLDRLEKIYTRVLQRFFQ